MKIKDTELSKIFGMTSATVGNYRKSKDGKYQLYLAMIEFYKKNSNRSVDVEFFVQDIKNYWIYKTIREGEPLFAYFQKTDLAVGTFSVDLEDDIEKIKNFMRQISIKEVYENKELLEETQ